MDLPLRALVEDSPPPLPPRVLEGAGPLEVGNPCTSGDRGEAGVLSREVDS